MDRRSVVRLVPLTLLLATPALPSAAAGQPHQPPAVDPQRLAPYVGAWRTADGATWALSRFDHHGAPVFLFTDFDAGWRGTLRPAGRDTLRVSERDREPRPRDPWAVLEGTDAIPILILVEPDGRVRRARRRPVREVDVQFESGDARLAGSLFLPDGPGPHPGVVFVHGSGPATRDDYREWSWFFAANGVAVLAYDKRGAGASTGDWRSARFEDLAADAAAAVERLRVEPSVVDSAVGLSGGSQGAWVAPLAAERTPVAWLVLTGGGALTPARQEAYRRVRKVRDAGHDSVSVAAAGRVLDAYFEYLRTEDPEAAEAVRRVWNDHADAAWFDLLEIPAENPTAGEWPEGRRRFQRELHFDPAPSLRAVDAPVLVVIGEDDAAFPAGETVDRFREILPTDRLVVEVVPGADHGLFVPRTNALPRHQSPEAFRRILEWILADR